jgi:outer membrane protein TolC
MTMIINPSKIYRFLAMCWLFAALSFGVRAEENTSAPLELIRAVEIATEDNPGLAQMQSRYLAMAEVPAQKGSLPDPQVSFNAMNLPVGSFDLSQEAMTQMQLGFAQTFPFPGKRKLRKEASEFEAAAARDDVDEARLQLVRGVKSGWWQVFYLDRSLEIVEANLKLLRQFVVIAQTKYNVGDGLQQDVLLAQLELSRLLSQQIEIRSKRRVQAAQLNALMGIAANKPVNLPAKMPSSLPAIASDDALYELALEYRPLLANQRNNLAAARSRLKLANRDYYPDFKVGLNYGFRSGDNPPNIGGARDDLLSLMFSMSVPLYANTKQDRAVAQRSNELTMRHYSLQDAITSIQSAITDTSSEYTRAKEQFDLFRTGIVPQARLTVDSMLSGYKVSRVDFLNLVRAQITLFNYEIQYWKALTEANQALAQLAASVGEENIYE